MITASPGKVATFAKSVLLKLGVREDDSEMVANHLVLANLFGVDSHGIVRLPYYVQGIRSGTLNPSPNRRVVKETENVIVLDGDSGLGQPAAMKVTEKVIEKAERNGVGLGGAVNLGHVGMLTHYVLEVVNSKMIGVAIANAPSVMAPLGAKKAFLGTNPIAIGLPYKKDCHLIFDSAMSVTSRGKILIASKKGEQIPTNWALDEEGNPTTDPGKAIRGALLPDGVKGYALALIIDLFCGAVLGGKFGFELPSNFSSQGGFSILVVNVEIFRGYEEYVKDLETYVSKLKSLPTAEGFGEIRIPGESKFRIIEERRAKGIPLDEETVTNLLELSKNLDVEFDLQ